MISLYSLKAIVCSGLCVVYSKQSLQWGVREICTARMLQVERHKRFTKFEDTDIVQFLAQVRAGAPASGTHGEMHCCFNNVAHPASCLALPRWSRSCLFRSTWDIWMHVARPTSCGHLHALASTQDWLGWTACCSACRQHCNRAGASFHAAGLQPVIN